MIKDVKDLNKKERREAILWKSRKRYQGALTAQDKVYKIITLIYIKHLSVFTCTSSCV